VNGYCDPAGGLLPGTLPGAPGGALGCVPALVDPPPDGFLPTEPAPPTPIEPLLDEALPVVLPPRPGVAVALGVPALGLSGAPIEPVFELEPACPVWASAAAALPPISAAASAAVRRYLKSMRCLLEYERRRRGNRDAGQRDVRRRSSMAVACGPGEQTNAAASTFFHVVKQIDCKKL